MSPLPLPRLSNAVLNGLNVLTDEQLLDACGVRIAFTSRQGGVSGGPYDSLNTGDHVEDDLASVMRNRAIVAEALGCADAPLVVPKQVHGTNVVHVESADDVARALAEADEGADAVLVGVPHVAALLNFADCLPLILVAPSGRFAVVHAGWRGALAGIAGVAVRQLAASEAAASGAEASGAATTDAASLDACESDASSATFAAQFNAYIGPHIRSECFETSEETATDFAGRYGDDVRVDDRHVSLARVVEVDLMRAGLVRERICDAQICTVCDSQRYFSFRASGGVCGRQAAAAVRHPAI